VVFLFFRKMDRIIVFDNGQVREEGSHEALVAKEGSLYGKLSCQV
jgi:ABC-type multidrug transport system fused ATPase/permease subunit